MTMTLATTLFSAARKIQPGNSPGTLALQGQFVLAGLKERDLVGKMLNPAPGTALERIMTERPQLLGALVWPYQCANWGVHDRLCRIIGHYLALDDLGASFHFSVEERLILVKLDYLQEGMMLVIDQPEWFLREGGLTLSLFLGSFRAFSVAFSLFRMSDGRLSATIGGVQGRNREDMLDTYRDMTKELHGLRPRDFLIEACRIVCRQLNVEVLQAVAESARHQRHPYFRKKLSTSQNYDTIWQDRGGVPVGLDLFELPVLPERRDLATLKPGKRPMYRRRFEFLDALEAEIAASLPGLRPVRFTDS
jgi:uncharacterized protein